MSIKPLHQLFLGHTSCCAIFDDRGERILSGGFVHGIPEFPAILLEKGDRGEGAHALVAVHKSVTFDEVKAERARDLRESARRERIVARVKCAVHGTFDFSNAVAVVSVATLLADELI